MTIDEMRKRKKELKYTYADISRLSGVPLSTIQKIMGGDTKSPRYSSIRAIEEVLFREETGKTDYREHLPSPGNLNETLMDYHSCRKASKTESCKDSYPLLPYKRQGEYTAEDRNRLPEEIRTELIDGVLYDLASPQNPHQITVSELHLLLNQYIEKSGKDCYVFLAPSDVYLTGDDKNIFQPDLYLICDYSMLGKNGYTKGAPPMIIEVLSPSTRSKDFLLKGYKYNKAGVKEYWLVDPEKRKVYVYDYQKYPDGTERDEYDFNSEVPIGLSEGKCSINFRKVAAALEKLGY